jgi:hypothetical protein
MARVQNIQIENASIGFRNFRGEPDKYNRNGKRSFCVFLDPEQADALEREGWNIKRRKPREDYPDEVPAPYMNVEVKYGKFPPVIHLISGDSQELLDEGTVGLLDSSEIENIDLVITPYQWTMDDGSSGIKAYLKSAWVTLAMDPFASKYARSPMNGGSVPFDEDTSY